MFANTDSEDDYLQDIALVAAAKAFGLPDPSSSSSSSAAANQSSASRRRSNLPRHADLTARSEDHGARGPPPPPPPPPDVDVLTGSYYNAGYGMGELCSVRSTSASCQSVLAAFCTIDPSLSSNSTSTDLFASWVTLLSTHVRFTNATGSQYVLSIGSIYPKGYGKNTTPFSTLAPSAKVEFVVEYEKVVGFGWYDLDEHVEREGSVENTSDVWFVKEA